MNIKTIAPLVIAVVLGLMAMWLASNMMPQPGPATVAGAPKVVRVVVAKAAITPGTVLTQELLTLQNVPGEAPPHGTFTDASQVVGRATTAPLIQGQPINTNLLAPPGAGGGLASLIPQGMRAITINVDESQSLAGMLAPGSMVDVVTTFQGGTAGPESKTVVQNVKVTAVGHRKGPSPISGDAPPEVFKTVTLLVTPEQAEAVELASSVSRPRLVLRTDGDTQILETAGMSLVDLRGGRMLTVDPFEQPVIPDDPAISPPATTRPAGYVQAHPPRTVRVIRGGVESAVTFETALPPTVMTTADTSPAH